MQFLKNQPELKMPRSNSNLAPRRNVKTLTATTIAGPRATSNMSSNS